MENVLMRNFTPNDWLERALGKRLIIDLDGEEESMLLELIGFDQNWLVMKGEDGRVGLMNRAKVDQMSVYEEDSRE